MNYFRIAAIKEISSDLLNEKADMKFFCYGASTATTRMRAINVQKLVENCSAEEPKTTHKGSIYGTQLVIYVMT